MLAFVHASMMLLLGKICWSSLFLSLVFLVDLYVSFRDGDDGKDGNRNCV